MGFLQPNMPDAEIVPETDPVMDEARRRELAIQRSRKLATQATRESLVIDTGTRTNGDAGLSIRR
jgi:hypothetical protein